MNFGLLVPAALTALAALAIPLLLHLIRRTEHRDTPFAALRWLRVANRQQRRLRWRDIPLLLLRLLLLALLALLLARPVLFGDGNAAPHWVLVAPGADVATARKRIDADDADWRWLAPGFPALAASAPPPTSRTASLLREVDAELPADRRLSIVVPATVDGLDGERPRLTRTTEWIVVPGAMPALPAATITSPATLHVRAGEADRSIASALRDAWQASAGPAVEIASVDVAIPSDARWLLWLSTGRPQALLDWIGHGGVAIAVATPEAVDAATMTPLWRDTGQRTIAAARAIGKGRLIELRGALTPARLPQLLDGDFPSRLLALLSSPAPAPSRADASALKPSPSLADATTQRELATRTPLDQPLALLLALLFAIERIWATTRRREAR